MLYLSKTRYCNALQCKKMLWLKQNMEEAFDDSVMNQAILDRGNQVGDLAMGLFGDYVEIPYGKSSEMVKATEEELAKGAKVIAEASFTYDGLFCSVDIFKQAEDGTYEIYEVKSSSKVNEIYVDDAAYQYYLLTKAGYEISKVTIVHINNEYVRHGELELDKLFHQKPVTEEVKAKKAEVETNIAEMRVYMEQENEPADGIGLHCFEPYDCGFFSHCCGEMPSPNIFDISRINKEKAFDCYYKGWTSFEALRENKVKLSDKQQVQVDTEVLDLEPTINKEEIRAFIEGVSYPMYFLDFESCQEAVPSYDGESPFDQLTFQYSLHILHEDGRLEHKEYLAYPGEDPRPKLAKQMCEDIPNDGCVVAYNAGFEKGRIKEMAALCPDLAEHLNIMRGSFVDLMTPFSKKWYYTREMQGSYSIKYVLPALFPDDPELDYSNLPGVKKGDQASNAFIEMMTAEPEEVERLRHELLEYCKLDTYAMVKIWQKLKEVTE